MKEKSYLINNIKLKNEWNYKKNNGLNPEFFDVSSRYKVWWICEKGHEWNAMVYDRTNGCGCPICSGHKVLVGYNDLATTHPHLAKEWHPTKNGELTPEDISYGSKQNIWWQCEKGHEWQATIYSRNAGCGCPYCSGRFAIKGENDLQTVNPTLAKEWNYEKNNGLTPMDVAPNSNKKVWWKCSKGHEWQAAVYSRTSGTGCPYCYKESRQKKNSCTVQLFF